MKWVSAAPAGPQAVAVRIRGRRDGDEAAFAAGLALLDRPDATYHVHADAKACFVSAETRLDERRLLYVDRIGTVASRRRSPSFERDAVERMAGALAEGFSQARLPSAARWMDLWERSDILIEGEGPEAAEDQLGVRYSLYRLLIAAGDDEGRVSIPACGLSGEGDRGMVFWDTDIHITPFFNFTRPAMAQNLAADRLNWTSVVRGYGGARPGGEGFIIEPRLPPRWNRLRFRLMWRGCDFTADIMRDHIKVASSSRSRADLPVRVGGQDGLIRPGQEMVVRTAG